MVATVPRTVCCPIEFKTAHPQTVNGAVMEFDRTKTNASGKPHDRVAVRSGYPFRRADAHAFAKSADDGRLLIHRNDVHGANP